jgi:hypothetical protein
MVDEMEGVVTEQELLESPDNIVVGEYRFVQGASNIISHQVKLYTVGTSCYTV